METRGQNGRPSGLDLRSSCISILADVIAEDCRYKVLNPRLVTPPYTLQAVCLDIGIALLEEDPQAETMAAVGSALLPAFDTFDPGLYPRLIACFEDGLLRPMLEQLVVIQNAGLDSLLAPGTENVRLSIGKKLP